MAPNCDNEPIASTYDRKKELEEFDSTKLGVKGLVDMGVKQIPQIFHHESKILSDILQNVTDACQDVIPVIDMSDPHQDLVRAIKEASAKFGFFQVINHGISVDQSDRLIKAIKAFHELPSEEKVGWYERNNIGKPISFFSNHDLFYSKAAGWRDTLHINLRFGSNPVDSSILPYVCRDEVLEWEKETKQLGARLMGLLSESLGLAPDRLTGLSYIGKTAINANYYPPCPEPTKTIGIASHRDFGTLTVLLQDHVGGLQIKYNDKWLKLKPVRGALVVNLGDFFQILSNDEYKSGEHCVTANPFDEPRVSVSVFFNSGSNEEVFGPLPELVSDEKPALYKQFKYTELTELFFTKELKGTVTDAFRL